MCGKSGGGDNSAAQNAQWQEMARQQQIQAGTHRINNVFNGQFTPDYYAKIAQGYTDFADPQLDNQYQQTQRQLSYSLARNGNLNSSTSADQQTDLANQYNANKLGIANAAQGYEQSAMSNVESARNNLINSLQSTGSAVGSSNNAANQAAALAAPPSYSALGNLFSQTTSALSSQAQLERAQALSGGLYSAPYNTGLFA